MWQLFVLWEETESELVRTGVLDRITELEGNDGTLALGYLHLERTIVVQRTIATLSHYEIDADAVGNLAAADDLPGALLHQSISGQAPSDPSRGYATAAV